MTRTQSTIVWGLALLVAAAVLAWQQSLPWALAAAGAVPTLVGVAKAIAEENVSSIARAAEQRAAARAKRISSTADPATPTT